MISRGSLQYKEETGEQVTNESTGTEMTSLRWTSRDLEAFPDDGKRYEIPGFACQVSLLFAGVI
jgi:hypothetical protein